ncbi:unnamed protein product [Caenorhabditis angaria]|uniref:SMC hinge domain-containing protein n=1 Tax=Caenorhabditis angaria TaxID=860376 RepID=A0A9P1IEW8_9PELO|nr:unnamed protein product [Caenorhabditis angaria]
MISSEFLIKNYSREFADIKRALPQIQRTWRDAQVEFPHIQNQEANLRNKLDVLRAKFNEDSRDNELLTKGSTVHIALLEAKASGRLPGLLGRLGDLGAIDPLYDAAISTTCPHLDWYVVETANDGQAAIDYLIECSLPRCSFMCLDQTLNAEASMNRNKKDFPAPRLFDLLRIQEPRIRKVFYQSVGDMLVVPGLLEAQRIDRQFHGKYRIVTYEGNTIERTGAVSGGGKAITGRIGSDIRAPQSEKQQEEFRQTKAQLDQTTEEHAEIYARYQFLEVQLADISKKANGMIAARDRLQNSFADQTTNIETKKRAVEAQENKVALAKFDPKEMEEKEKKLEEMKKELQEAEAEAKAVKIKVTKCSSKIDGMFNELVAKYRARAALAKERYMNVEEEIAKENAAIINSQHNVAAMERLLVELRDTLMKKRIECDALGSAEADGKEVFALNDLVRNRRQKLSLLRDAAQELRKRRQELDEEERNQNRNLTDLRDSLTSLNQSLDDIELQLEGFQRQIAALKIRKIPDFSKYENVRIDHDIGWIEEDQDEDQEEDSERRRRMKRENEETQRNVVTFEDVEEFTMMTDMEIEDMTRAEKEKIRQNLKSLEKYMETNRENTDESIFDEYIKKAKIYLAHVEKLDKFGVNLQIHRKKLGELRQFRYSEFADALAFLGATTQALYQLITNGGDASLKFVEEGRTADPFEAGVKFSVRPAKKSWKLIENLSGGEKTLASLCFVFAMHHYRSTPLYVMDEIDAALDSQNVRLIANYIRNSERTKNAQFIIISLRNQMFEVGNRLIGVYKVNDCTHHVVLAPKQLKNTVQEVTQKLMEKLKLHRKAAEAPEASASTKQFFLQPTVFLAPKTPVATTPRRRTIIAPRIEDLEPVVMTSSTNGIKQKQVVEVVFENDFDFEEDEAPVKKRRRRTVCDDDDDEEEEEDQEEEFAEVATTSNAATNSPTTSRRATRSTCK